MRRYVDLALEHFGDDEKGRARVERFFLWHCGFWHRYHPWTEDDFRRPGPESLMQAAHAAGRRRRRTRCCWRAPTEDDHRLHLAPRP